MTLIELLVVIVIIAVLVVGVGLSVGLTGKADTKAEAERLAMGLETLSLSARTTGKKFAWSFSVDEYQFLEQLADGEWKLMAQNSDFLPRTLPETVRITDALWEGQPVVPGQRVVFSITPPILTLSMSGNDTRYRIVASPAGSIRANPEVEEVRKR
jgi:prepilin-type N-terminal cleavage/methylation domain-containing protein